MSVLSSFPIQDQLQAMEKARQRKKGVTPGMEPSVGGNGGGQTAEGVEGEATTATNSDDEEDEDFMSMDPFVPQVWLIYGKMLKWIERWG